MTMTRWREMGLVACCMAIAVSAGVALKTAARGGGALRAAKKCITGAEPNS